MQIKTAVFAKIRRYKVSIIFCIIVAGIAAFVGCGGGGGSGPPTPDDPITPEDSTPEITGFDFSLQEGDFWEYGWDYKHSYVSSHSSSSGSYSSTFRITLGPPLTKDSMIFYEMLISGTTIAGDRKDVTPKGKYISVSDNKILFLDSDGTSLQTIFDAQTGYWPGSGFFADFPEDVLFEASLSTINNDYINQSAYMVRESASASQCEYFPGIGNICGGDYNENMDEREYYMEGVGAIGYYANFSMSDWSSPDGGWSASNTTNIGLVASSLRADTVDYLLEVEPNNQMSEATPITLPTKIMGDDVSEDNLGGTTAVSVAMTSVSEVEPNDSPLAPQTVDTLSVISGDVLEGDASTTVNVPPTSDSPSYIASFEDWYQVTLKTGSNLNAALDFPGTGADLDMYLFSLENSTSVLIQDRSAEDNIASGIYKEKIIHYLSAGTYYLAIDGYATQEGRADYTLAISTGNSSIDICDWFSFFLVSLAQVTVSMTGDPNFVLMDATGANTLASNGTAGSSITLPAGSFLIGVSEGGAYTLEVSSQ